MFSNCILFRKKPNLDTFSRKQLGKAWDVIVGLPDFPEQFDQIVEHVSLKTKNIPYNVPH